MPGPPAPIHTSATSPVVEGITPGPGAPFPPIPKRGNPHGLGIPTASTIAPATAASNFGGVVTPVNVFNLQWALRSHPDRFFVNKLCLELREGASIGYSGPRQFRFSRNLLTASLNPDVVSSNLAEEVAKGRTADPFPSPPLQLILRGVKRSQGDNSKTRRPITLPILNLFYHLLNVRYTSNKDSLMVWAAMTLAFFGFLRIGELTCDFHFNPERHLTFSDLVFMPTSSPKYMLVRLKVSKTDPFRKGQTIVIGKTNSHLCPLSAMLVYLESRNPFPTTRPLFTFQSGSFLTRGKFTNETRLLLSKGGLNSAEFAGHSFRIGEVPQLPRLTYPLGSLRP